ncbi:MAG: Tim44/TimA family putative adaptor protein [Pseudomonadota bacterium]
MNDPVLIFFVALAAFLSYRLFSVLGTKGGHEPKDADAERVRASISGNDNAEADSDRAETDPLPRAPLPAWAETVTQHYPAFEHERFLDGAKSAYEMIVQSFARGELGKIRDYVDPAVMKTFEVAVDGRQNAGQTMDVTFVGIEKADVVSAELRSNHIEVVVDFKSDQIRMVRDADGNIVDGDPNRIDLVRDRWTFSRPAHSTDPNWILTATDGAAN